MSQTPRPLRLLYLGIASLFAARQLQAIDCSTPTTMFESSMGDFFNITLAGFATSDIGAAGSYWACPSYLGGVPTFQVGGTGGVPVTVVKRIGNSPAEVGGCGQTTREIVYGHLESATIEIWTNQHDGASCEPLTDSLAHEFGHLMGLDDASDPMACLGHIMGARVFGGTRSVAADDCEVADLKWTTTTEWQEPSDPYCDAYCWTSCIDNACPPRPPGGYGCPVLLDIENDGIHLTGLNDPVWFDIDADGRLDLMSWTNQSEGFLVLDRNGNGTIDDGSELFGNYTRLSDGSRALNGYLALAELDSVAFGGNGDGFLDPSDAPYSVLRVWADRNHDGVSQPGELKPLAEVGVGRISLDYRRSNRTDRFGNEFRFRGTAWMVGSGGRQHPVPTWDVFFVVAVP